MKRIVLITLISIVSTVLILAGAGIIYLQVNYSRYGNIDLDINNNQNSGISINTEYSISTYNVGFGAYELDYSFFMDKSETVDGIITKGQYGRAFSYNSVITNTTGAISVLESLNSDFMMIQEIDTNSTRSYKVNQVNMVADHFTGYVNTYASNFHSGYLPVPITDMHGIVNSGIMTLSKYKINESTRIELPVTTSFFAKFFDLDRCLNMIRVPIDGSDKELVIINGHFSAYDEGGVYRKLQLELLNSILREEYDKNNYVIAGGDFNHELANSSFETNKITPIWISQLTNDMLTENYSIQADGNTPTCRDSEAPYIANETFTAVVDGYIVSDNIEVVLVQNIVGVNGEDISFHYSDHNAVEIKFMLK